MDILKAFKVFKWMGVGLKKMALPLVLVFALFGVGLIFKYFVDHIDHPVEQVIEEVLKDNGVDIDFSANKKN
jgi:hypothetical protein